MTKRIAAIILAAVMMIPTHVTSFAADASAQNTAGQEAGNATSGDSQTTQSENQAATQNDSSTTGTDTNAGSTNYTKQLCFRYEEQHNKYFCFGCTEQHNK